MSLLSDDRGASPHERGATDAAHLLIPYALAGLGGAWLAVWCAAFGVAQVVQLARQWPPRGLAWGDFALDVAVTVAGAWLALAGLGSVTTGLALTGLIGGLYTWRHRYAWGLAS